MDGIESLQTYRQHALTLKGRVVIVVLTTSQHGRDIERIKALGAAVGILTKPLTKRESRACYENTSLSCSPSRVAGGYSSGWATQARRYGWRGTGNVWLKPLNQGHSFDTRLGVLLQPNERYAPCCQCWITALTTSPILAIYYVFYGLCCKYCVCLLPSFPTLSTRCRY